MAWAPEQPPLPSATSARSHAKRHQGPGQPGEILCSVIPRASSWSGRYALFVGRATGIVTPSGGTNDPRSRCSGLGPGEVELGGGGARDGGRVARGGDQGAAGLAVTAGDGALGGVYADGFARGGAGGPDALQGPVEHRVIGAGLAAQGQRQVAGTDVQAVDTVDGQGG